LLRLIREALVHKPRKRGTNVQGALTFLNHVIHRRGIVFLLTDFLHSVGEAGVKGRDLFSEIGQTNARHDLVCLHLTDPRERALLPAGLLTVEDAETGEQCEVDTMRESIRNNFAESSARRLEQLDRSLGQTGVDVLRLAPGDDYASTLQRFFEQRRER
jgi:uncharacterized protein (DUF58 family)